MIHKQQTRSLVAHRLRQKKANRSVSRFIIPVTQIFKNHSRNYFFSTITILLLLAIFSISFTNNLNNTVSRINSDIPELTKSLAKLLYANPKTLQEDLEEIKQTIISDLDPILSFTGTKVFVEEDFDKAIFLSTEWLEALRPLLDYQLTVKGLTNLKDQNLTFTNDLEVFFEKLEKRLLPETQAMWQEIGPYMFFAKLSGNSKVYQIDSIISNLLDISNIIVKNKENILQILGHREKQKLVIFNQNIGEARPTGGFIGSYISIDIEKGMMNINESNSIYYPDGSIKEKLYMHPATAYYGWATNVEVADDHGIRNANFLPCFPETASTMYQGFLDSTNGYKIDLVMFITPQLLLDILGANFSFEVPEVGELNSYNIMDEIEILTGIEYTDKSNPKKDIKEILESLLREFPRIVKQNSPVGWLNIILRAIDSRDLQIWTSYKQAQSFFEEVGLTNLALCNRSFIPEIGFILGNISGDKRGTVSENQFNIYTKNTLIGTEITIKYKQILPEKPVLARGFSKSGSFTFAGLQIPSEAINMSVTSPQAYYIPFIRPYYEELFKMRSNKQLTQLPQIEFIASSSKNLYSDTGNPPGFVYEHQNGSKVIGIYIADSGALSEVEFSFILPGKVDVINFFGQPGLREPSLGLGKGAQFYNSTNYFNNSNNYYQIASGQLILIK